MSVKRRKTTTVFHGNLLTLSIEHVVLPNGYRVRLEKITHPGAVLIVPFVTKGAIILIRQYRPVIKQYLYELPAGTRDGREPWLACARRELREETGFVAGQWEKRGVMYPVPGYSTERIMVFAAYNLMKGTRTMEKDEVITERRVSRRQLRQLVARGRLQDAKTLAALGLCGWL